MLSDVRVGNQAWAALDRAAMEGDRARLNVWIRRNLVCLKQTIRPQEVLDRLTVLGHFKPGTEDYERIRHGPVWESKQCLVSSVMRKGASGMGDFCRIVAELYPGRAWKGSSPGELLDVIGAQPTPSNAVRLSPRAPARAANRATTPSTAIDGASPLPASGRSSSTALPIRPFKTRVGLRRRTKKTMTRNVLSSSSLSLLLVGAMAIAAYQIDYLQQWFPLVMGENTRSACSNRTCQQKLPGEVADFKSGPLARSIEARAHDNAFPWLDEPRQPVEKLHVNLVVTTKAEQPEQRKTKEGSKTPALSIPSHGSTFERRPVVDVSDIFNPSVDGSTTPISTVVLRAESGMGKTFTFAKMMPLRWLEDKTFWPEFDLVFVISLGDPEIQNARTVKDVFFAQFGGSVAQGTINKVMDYIKSNPHRVLLICDAFDEGQKYLPNVVRKIFEGKVIPGLRLLITSRPCSGAKKLARHAHRQLDLLGLAKEDLPEFIRKQLRP